MTQNRSSILYESPSKTIFLIDIPTSITLAQELSPAQRQQLPENHYQHHKDQKEKQKQSCLLSTPPLKAPYPSPPEPKTEKARTKVLERIPQAERVYHDDVIGPMVSDGLREIAARFADPDHGREWCLGRCVADTETLFSFGEQDGSSHDVDYDVDHGGDHGDEENPPVILSPTCKNAFESLGELRNVLVQNTSTESALLVILRKPAGQQQQASHAFNVPALSNFLLCRLSMSIHADPKACTELIPGISPSQKFDLILLDPPWPNRSVRRSGYYATQAYPDMDALTEYISNILRRHLPNTSPSDAMTSTAASNDRLGCEAGIAAIWITNAPKARKATYDAIRSAGLSICEEWVWIKTTTSGEPITPVDGLWRKPYEILVIGKSVGSVGEEGVDVTRRIIAAVPDVHSRKPNLREFFEGLFFGKDKSYAALEVFARNLTAGWWACGDEILKFNAEEWWV